MHFTWLRHEPLHSLLLVRTVFMLAKAWTEYTVPTNMHGMQQVHLQLHAHQPESAGSR